MTKPKPLSVVTLVSLYFFLGTFFCMAQNETKERLITNRRVLSFDSNQKPILRNDSKPFFDLYNPNYLRYPFPIPNSICGDDGKLLMYSDGLCVYNKNKEIMQDGILRGNSFSGLNKYSVFIPIEENNRRYYYLFESIPYETNWDFTADKPTIFYFDEFCKLEYSIIDIQANNGLGAVIKKNILLQDSIAPTISATKHSNNIDTWLVTHKTFSNKFYTYKISSCSILSIDTAIVENYYMIPNIGYSNIVNICNLTFSSKGDFVNITGYHKKNLSDLKQFLYVLPFDNSTGKINELAVDTIRNLVVQYGQHLFSHDSKFIYSTGNINSHIGSQHYFYVTDLTTLTAKRYDLRKDSSANNFMIDYGFNNDLVTIYAYGYGNPYFLGKLNGIDQFNALPVQNDTLLFTYTNEYPTSDFNFLYFPTRNNHITSFYHPSYSKPSPTAPYAPSLSSAKEVYCYKDSIHLLASTSSPVDSLVWTLQNSNGLEEKIYGTDFLKKITPGDYFITLEAYNYCIPEVTSTHFTVEPAPLVILDKDTAYKCETVPSEFPSAIANEPYHWENADNIAVSDIQQEGAYFATCANSCGIAVDTLSVVNSILKIPNLLTPNGDDKNELWQLTSNNPNTSISLSLFNRWGNNVYENSDYKNDWTPLNLSDGIYYYQIEQDGGCIKKGWLEIIR